VATGRSDYRRQGHQRSQNPKAGPHDDEALSSTTSDSVVGTKVHSTRKDQEGDRCRQHLIHPAEGSALDSEPMFDREKAIATIEAGRCPCPGCAGALTEDKLSARSWRHAGSAAAAGRWRTSVSSGMRPR